MKEKKTAKICSILYAITALLFTLTGISNIVDEQLSTMIGWTNIAMAVTFGSLGIIYYKKSKAE